VSQGIDLVRSSLLSRCTEIADCVTIFFNAFPRFDYNVTALKSRTRVLKQRTKLRLKFVRDLAATPQIQTIKSLHPIPFDGTLFIRDLSAVRSSLSAI
jgi:hypothetical protein